MHRDRVLFYLGKSLNPQGIYNAAEVVKPFYMPVSEVCSEPKNSLPWALSNAPMGCAHVGNRPPGRDQAIVLPAAAVSRALQLRWPSPAGTDRTVRQVAANWLLCFAGHGLSSRSEANAATFPFLLLFVDPPHLIPSPPPLMPVTRVVSPSSRRRPPAVISSCQWSRLNLQQTIYIKYALQTNLHYKKSNHTTPSKVEGKVEIQK